MEGEETAATLKQQILDKDDNKFQCRFVKHVGQ